MPAGQNIFGGQRCGAQQRIIGFNLGFPVNDVWPDIYDFIFYNILPLIILLVYGPEKKPWFDNIIYYIDDLIILFCLCVLPSTYSRRNDLDPLVRFVRRWIC